MNAIHVFAFKNHVFMEENKSIEQVLENLDKNIVYKTKDSMLLGFLLSIAGIASFIIYSSFEWESNNVFAHILFVLGSILLVLGMIKIFFRKSRYVQAENNKKIRSLELYFNMKEEGKLLRLLESGNMAEIKNLNPSSVSGLKLRIMATPDGRLCFSQVVAFSTNEYINVTAAMKHSLPEYQILSEIIASRK